MKKNIHRGGNFRDFLKEELAPYPGRVALVARMIISATLVMLITMTFRLPFGVLAFYAIIVSRETHWATIKTVTIACDDDFAVGEFGIAG